MTGHNPVGLVFRQVMSSEPRHIRSILIRRGTTIEWGVNDPVLQDREPVTDTTRRTIKIGDGIHRYSDLPDATPEEVFDLLVNAVPTPTKG